MSGDNPIAGGMDLTMSDSVSLDMRDLLADQLNEIRAMREEIEKSNQGKADGAILPADENPYVMNPYYTEHHDDAVARAMSQVSTSHEQAFADVPDGPGFMGTLSDYANETGFRQTMFGDRLVNGRGVTEKEADLARMQFGDRIVNTTLDKVEGVATFGGSIGADMGVGMMLGGPVGMAAGLVAGAGTAWMIREGIDEVETYQDYRNMLYANSDRFISSSESSDGQGGFTKRESRKAARQLSRMNREFGITDEEMSEIFTGVMDNDLLTTTSNVEEFSQRMSDLVSVVKTSAKTLGMTMTEVTDMMGELEREGIGLGTQGILLQGMDATASSLGMSTQQYNQMLTTQVGNATYGTSADASSTAIAIDADNSLMGRLKEAASKAIGRDEDTYSDRALANYEGTVGDMVSLLENAGYGGIGRQAMAAALTEGENGMIIDYSKFNEFVDLSKENPDQAQASMNKAIEENKAKYGEMYIPKLNIASEEFMAEEGVNYAAALFDLSRDAVLNLNGISPEEFAKMSKTEQEEMMMTYMRGQGMDESDAVIIAGMTNYTDATTQSQQLIGNTFAGAAATAEDNKWWNPLDGGKWYNPFDATPRYLKNFDITSNYDYTDLSGIGEDLNYAEAQSEKTINAILFGTLGDSGAYGYKNRMALNNVKKAEGPFGWRMIGEETTIQDDINIFADALHNEASTSWANGTMGDNALMQYVEEVGGEKMYEDLKKARAESDDDAFKDIAAELMSITENSMKNKNVTDSQLDNGYTEEQAQKAVDAVDKNTKAQELLLETLRDGFLKSTDNILEFVDLMKQ